MLNTFENDARLILSDSHGVYIPQLFCADIDAADAARIGVDFTDVQCCQAGPTPSNEWYWEAWQAILDSAVVIDDNGTRWCLYQDGDLWELPEGCELPDWL